MNHARMCPLSPHEIDHHDSYWCDQSCEVECQCDLITRVREDERGKRRMVPGGGLAGYNEGYALGQRDEQANRYEAQSENWEKGYAAALDAAREAVAALRGENENVLPRQFRAQALAAIEALGGER